MRWWNNIANMQQICNSEVEICCLLTKGFVALQNLALNSNKEAVEKKGMWEAWITKCLNLDPDGAGGEVQILSPRAITAKSRGEEAGRQCEVSLPPCALSPSPTPPFKASGSGGAPDWNYSVPSALKKQSSQPRAAGQQLRRDTPP